MSSVRFLARPPCPALAPFVQSIWLFESDGTELAHRWERVMPTGDAQLLVNLAADRLRWRTGPRLERAHAIPGASIGGPFDRGIGIDTRDQRRIAGVSFRPGGLPVFVTTDAAALAGEHVPLDALWGRDGATVRERLLEQREPEALLAELERTLLSRVARPLTRDAAVDRAIVLLGRGASIRDTSASIGVTDRALLRRFTATVGLTPKRWSRVRRLQRVLASVAARPPERWSLVAAEHGYADQAHLNHELRELAGIRPTEYRPRSVEERNHVPVLDPLGA